MAQKGAWVRTYGHSRSGQIRRWTWRLEVQGSSPCPVELRRLRAGGLGLRRVPWRIQIPRGLEWNVSLNMQRVHPLRLAAPQYGLSQ
jgi:hypothetical protein